MIPVYGPHHAPEFHDDDQVAITVSNRGGAPVTVNQLRRWRGAGKRLQNNLLVMERLGGEPDVYQNIAVIITHRNRSHDDHPTADPRLAPQTLVGRSA